MASFHLLVWRKLEANSLCVGILLATAAFVVIPSAEHTVVQGETRHPANLFVVSVQRVAALQGCLCVVVLSLQVVGADTPGVSSGKKGGKAEESSKQLHFGNLLKYVFFLLVNGRSKLSQLLVDRM